MNPTAQRQAMILGQIYTNDIIDERILTAMADIPREPFLPERLRGAAYVDEDLEISPGRYAMEPLTLAKLLDLAAILPSSRVLVIGCLQGYSAAIISRLAGEVIAVDIDSSAVDTAREHMKRLNIANVELQTVASLPDGYAAAAPYDIIVINGAVSFLPEALGAQLAMGGRLVTVRNVATRPGMKGGLGKGLLVERLDQRLQYREHFDASTVILPGFEADNGFRF